MAPTHGNDFRFAVRRLQRNKTATGWMVGTFAVALWANILVWAIGLPLAVDPLPYPDADRVVRVWQAKITSPLDRSNAAYGNLLLWRERSQTAQTVGAYATPPRQLLAESVEPGTFEPVRHAIATEGFFEVLGIQPVLGRLFNDEERRTGPSALVISHAYWLRRFGGDPGVIGRLIARPERSSSVIIGVMPPGFDYPVSTEAWYPGYVPKALIRDQNSRDLRVIAKLKPGMTSELFRQELLRLQSDAAKEFPATDLTWAPIVAPLRDELLGDVRPALISLYVLITLLALLGFVNVLTLMLVRADARRTQYATQLALGSPAAGPRMQLIAEGLIVALMGWGIAVVVARATVGLVVSWLPASLPQLGAIALDIRLLCISLGIAIVAGVVWGVLTALHIEQLGVIEALAFNQRDSSEQAPRRRWRDAAVVCEVAIAVVILAAALVSVAEMRRLHQSDPGFSGREVVAARIHVSIARLEEIYRTLAAKSPMGQRLPNNGISNVIFAQDLLAQVADIPGVQLASVSGTLPLADPLLTVFVSRADSPASATGDSRSDSLSAYLVEATEDFFRVLRTPLHSGRFFSELDRMGAEPVAIVNQTLARRLWGSGPAVGRLLAQARHEKPLRVVGVVADMARLRPGELPVPTIYRPFAQSPPASIRLLILADTTAQRIRPALSEAARRLGGNLIDAQDLSSIIAQSIAPARSTALALGMLATIAMLLAFAGLEMSR